MGSCVRGQWALPWHQGLCQNNTQRYHTISFIQHWHIKWTWLVGQLCVGAVGITLASGSVSKQYTEIPYNKLHTTLTHQVYLASGAIVCAGTVGIALASGSVTIAVQYSTKWDKTVQYSETCTEMWVCIKTILLLYKQAS